MFPVGNTFQLVSVAVHISLSADQHQFFFLFFYKCAALSILNAKSNFTLLLYMPFLGIGEWYFKCV